MLRTLRSQQGQTLLVLILIVDLLIAAGLGVALQYGARQTQLRIDETQRFLLSEATQSSFVVMEAALRRRLWEAPPDANCLKSQNFKVAGQTVNGVTWSVTANYNPATKVYDLVADGKYRAVTARYYKQIKVRDASDYLLLNNNDNNVSLYRTYEAHGSVGFVANKRLIYTKGSMSFTPNVFRSTTAPDNRFTAVGPVNWPEEFPIVLQSERMQIAKGLKYSVDGGVVTPDAGAGVALKNVLAPYSQEYTGAAVAPYTYYGQAGGGSAVLTKDYALGLKLQEALKTNSVAGLNQAAIKRQVYPIALFGDGGHPLIAQNGVDSGSFANNIDNWNIFYYSYSANHYGVLSNLTCLSRKNAATGVVKSCSDSEVWPKGFEAWKKSAGLAQTLFTKETESISLQPIDWDNMEALEEDARACGQVIEKGAGTTYEDCQAWDRNFLDTFSATGAAPACQKISKFDMEALALSNFSTAPLTDDSLKDRLLRRVLYFKGPTELSQVNKNGLFSSLGSPVARDRLTLWLINEDVFSLRGFQNDTTSPLQSAPERLREIVFNADATQASGLGQRPLRLVMMSPETVQLVSPQYVPLSAAMFNNRYGVSGGRLIPKMSMLYDDERFEDDAYMYGSRAYRVENMVYITGGPAAISSGFFLKGLWSAMDSGAEQYIRNQCFFNLPGTLNGTGPGQDEFGPFPAPAYAGNTIPRLGSRFYSPGNIVPSGIYPEVFVKQVAASPGGLQRESHVSFSGIRLIIDFDDTAPPPGKNKLSAMRYLPRDTYDIGDMPNRKYLWRKPYYWQAANPPNGRACVKSSLVRLDGGTSPSFLAGSFKVNEGRAQLLHDAPPIDTLSDVGALFGVDLPTVQVKQ